MYVVGYLSMLNRVRISKGLRDRDKDMTGF